MSRVAEIILIGQISLHALSWILVIGFVHLSPQYSLKYCEGNISYDHTIFAHPFNTYSNVFLYTAAWLQAVVVWYVYYQTKDYIYSLGIPVVTLHLATASFIYHGILYDWAGVWDFVAIIIYLSFEAATSIYRLIVRINQWFGFWPNFIRILVWTVLSVMMSILTYFTPDPHLSSKWIGGTLVALITVCELVLISYINIKEKKRLQWWVYMDYALIPIFGVPAATTWILGATPHESPCETGVHYVGHGVWHALIGGTIFALFLTRYLVDTQLEKYQKVVPKESSSSEPESLGKGSSGRRKPVRE